VHLVGGTGIGGLPRGLVILPPRCNQEPSWSMNLLSIYPRIFLSVFIVYYLSLSYRVVYSILCSSVLVVLD